MYRAKPTSTNGNPCPNPARSGPTNQQPYRSSGDEECANSHQRRNSSAAHTRPGRCRNL
jgi:hypothetical protein